MSSTDKPASIAPAAHTVESISNLSNEIVSNSPIYRFLFQELKITKVSKGEIEATLPLRPAHLNSKDILHGSTSATLVDWIGGLLIVSSSPSSKRGVSVDIHVTYSGSASLGDELIIRGRADKVGRNLAFLKVDIFARPLTDPSSGTSKERLIVSGSHTKYVG
ncbi:Thioesterase/thiol ester dehydrase-isomerase [Violaceomyces palustris]|uniref:Thioesterase/thiol ester dehydrase-isomerase n=1 Tax=Violaceomyces palustris TaxID=1673888 RepID=A0ACD0NZY2_9BASI|nr:Thioesterase/thiol ester dehydrase-isomerase [Violaceomyces palustris]